LAKQPLNRRVTSTRARRSAVRHSNVRRRSSQRAETGRRWRSVVLSSILTLFALGLLGTVGTIGLIGYYSQGLPSLDSLRVSNLDQTTRILDRNGQLITSLYQENRTLVPLSKVAPALQDATISVEDRNFYTHQGVDYRRVLIAAAYDLTHRTSAIGGSTITQQVIKDLVLCDSCSSGHVSGVADRTFGRKMRELLLAEELERRYTKPQILELYLNSIFYGNRAFGIEAAAQTYFGVSAAQLTLPQASYLAGLPQSPSAFNPFAGAEARAAGKERWRQVLDAMVANHKLTPEQAEAAFKTDIWSVLDKQHAGAKAGQDPLTGHFVDYTLQYLRAHGYDEGTLLRGGLTIYTTIDLDTQRKAQKAVAGGITAYRVKGVNTGALLVMDPHNGEILAMIGSGDYSSEDIQGQVNLTVVGRQPGSSFKPYTYATALATGRYTSATPVDDLHDTIGGKHFSDWNGVKEGWIPLRQAVKESRNLPALWTYQDVGPQNVNDFAHRLGITTNLETNLTTTIGSSDVRMVEHVAAYSAFDNGGYRVYAHPILKITDAAGRLQPAFPENVPGGQVMSPQLAYLMTDIMHTWPSERFGWRDRPAAGKSGTSESYTNNWYVGYTPDIAIGAWLGHVNKGDQCNSGYANLASSDVKTSGWICPVNVLFGEHVAISVWKPFLDDYYSNHRWPAYWKRPDGLVTRTVCKLDGQLATDSTPPDQRVNEIFIAGLGEPKGSCGSALPPGATPYPTPSHSQSGDSSSSDDEDSQPSPSPTKTP
jgi:membrane peptidoglycan carboxypeptidase